jgi:hypothetical protein
MIKIADDEKRLIDVQTARAVLEEFAGLILTELSALPQD